jgi:hypothetical protein
LGSLLYSLHSVKTVYIEQSSDPFKNAFPVRSCGCFGCWVVPKGDFLLPLYLSSVRASSCYLSLYRAQGSESGLASQGSLVSFPFLPSCLSYAASYTFVFQVVHCTPLFRFPLSPLSLRSSSSIASLLWRPAVVPTVNWTSAITSALWAVGSLSHPVFTCGVNRGASLNPPFSWYTIACWRGCFFRLDFDSCHCWFILMHKT